MVEVRIPEIDVVLAYGHAEYLPTFPNGKAEQVWPLDDDDFENWLWEQQEGENVEALRVKWVEVTGLSADRLPDADLIWDHVFWVRCTRAEFEDAFEAFMVTMSEPPSGDDDTFDYWPSGARLLIAMGEVLSAAHEHRAFNMIRDLIIETMGEWAEELLVKTGTEGDQ